MVLLKCIDIVGKHAGPQLGALKLKFLSNCRLRNPFAASNVAFAPSREKRTVFYKRTAFFCSNHHNLMQNIIQIWLIISYFSHSIWNLIKIFLWIKLQVYQCVFAMSKSSYARIQPRKQLLWRVYTIFHSQPYKVQLIELTSQELDVVGITEFF